MASEHDHNHDHPESHEAHDHGRDDHGRHDDHGHADEPGGRLKFAIGLLTLTLVAEFVGGWLTNSLALLADAGHVFMDLFALGLSLWAIMLAKLPPSSTKTYGWHRAEILAALINGVALAGLSLLLFHEAWERLHSPQEVRSIPMLIVAVLGLGVNLVIAFRLHGHHHGDLNLTSAYLHVLGDAAASVGVIVAAIIIAATDWYVVDSLISAGIGLLILAGSVRLVYNAGHVLMEAVPGHLSLDAVADAIREVGGVEDVHDVHIWTVCSHIVSLSCHVNIKPGAPEFHDQVVRAVAGMLWRTFAIMHSTVQVDYSGCSDDVVPGHMTHG